MKVLVIGGGLAGVQTAYFLLRDGHDVSVIERRSDVALETSFANGGLITPSHAAPWNSPGIFKTLLTSVGKKDGAIHVKLGALGQYLGWGRQFLRNSTKKRFYRTIARNLVLAQYSQTIFHQLLSDVALDFFHQADGSVMIYRSKSSFESAQERSREMVRLGLKAQVCGPTDLIALEPALSIAKTELSGGIFFPGDEHGDAAQFTRSLAAYLVDNGVGMETGTTVEDFLVSEGKVIGVRTDRGEHTAGAVVVACGHWSTTLSAKLGVSLPVRPVKGSSLTYHLPDWNAAPAIPVIDDDLHVAITPMGENIRIVGTAEFCGYDPEVRPERMAMLRRSALAILPQLHDEISKVAPLLEWSGHRPMTPDCLPVVGECRVKNLYLNTGHGYLGWTTGAGTSRAVADLISGRRPELNLSNYGLERF